MRIGVEVDRPYVSWVVMAVACLVCATCASAPAAVASFPPAEVWNPVSRFEGQWLGEVADVPGTLQISPLGEGRYYGRFAGENIALEYVLSLQQRVQDGVPTNLSTMTWQDGRGGRGAGWLLINREDTALAGSFGRGEKRTEGLGTWTFIRLEAG